jgi:outer membrane protein OmpA-like peptidoglycan-associated protein
VPAAVPPPPLPDLPLEPPAEETPLVKLAGDTLVLGEPIRFHLGKATLAPESHAVLDQVARLLASHPELALVEVQGHTDNQGPAAKNRKLSQARAEAVVRYLAGSGVDPRRLRAKGYGADRPLAPNFNKRNRELNRRVELHVIERRSPPGAG